MIIKKLAVPLINEKILQQAVHCYIATSSISEAGFDFIRSRISPKTKIDIVTGLDATSSPVVLQRIITNYQGRINLHIYTRNVLHANLYIFDLPFRKSVAFVGSGGLTLEALKDHEELFWKITDPKEIESLMSWYTSYFQFGVPLNEDIVREYAIIYPQLREREISSREEQDQLIALTAGSFHWDSIKFRNQFFGKEHYQTFSAEYAINDNAAIRLSRMAVQEKLQELKVLLESAKSPLKLVMKDNPQLNSLELADHPGRVIRFMAIEYLKPGVTEGINFQIGMNLMSFFVRIEITSSGNGAKVLQYVRDQMELENFREGFFNSLSRFGKEYALEVGGSKKGITSFPNAQSLYEFFKTEDLKYFPVKIEKTFSPGDSNISVTNIVPAIQNEFANLEIIVRAIGV